MDFTPVTTLAKSKEQIQSKATALLYAVGVMFGLEAADILLPDRWSPDRLGVRPHEFWSLLDIPIAPWLHADFHHVMGNAVPFFFLGLLISLTSWRRLLEVSVISAVASGLGIFFFGQTGTNHIGASGVVAGYLGYVVSRGFLDRRPLLLLVSVVVGLYQFFNIVGLLVPRTGVSWTAHFFGLCGGVLAAWLLAPRNESGAGAAPDTGAHV